MDLKAALGTVIKKEGLEDAAMAKLTEYAGTFKNVAAILEPLGFTVGKFTIGMGVLPEVHTSISGSIDKISEDGLTKLMNEHQTDTLLVSLVKALIMTKRLWDHMELKLTSLTVNVTLGVPPKIAIDLN